MRQGLIDAVKNIAGEELKIALLEHGEFKNHHEAYAVIKEEIEEVQDELSKVNNNFKCLWNMIKENNINPLSFEIIQAYAINMACEAIQVAAMAQKAMRIEAEQIKTSTVIKEKADT